MLILALLFFSIAWSCVRPSNDRDWTVDQAILPYAEIDGDQVHVHEIRNFTYRSTTDYTGDYYDKTFDLSKLKKVYFIVDPFSHLKATAHTFVSFEFEGPEFLAISVEIRKEKGESFSPTLGLLKQYEIMYVIADEKDAIKLRSNYRNDQVFVYPMNTTQEKVRAMFVEMIERANALKVKPEFYNSLTNNCTTNLVDHANAITPGRIPWSYKILFPGYSDELIYDLGMIDTNLPFEEARAYFDITDRAEKYVDDPDFSVKIRTAE